MDRISSASNAPLLEPVLRRLRQRIRRVLAIRGALITTVTALAGLLALATLDFAVSPLPAFVRWMCPFLWIAAVTTVATIWWWLPLRKPLELVRIARWLETRRPDLDERVSTVLEVSAQGDSGMSSQLLDMIAREAVGCLGQIDPQVEVSTRLARRWLWPAAALSLVWAVLFALWPSPTARHVVRVLVPGSHLGTAAGRIAVTPGSVELFEGDPLQISARHSAGSRTDLEVVLHLPDGTSTVMPMEKADDGSVYRLGRADKGFDYEVRAGRETSDRFHITVWPRPRLAAQRVRLEFPAYTGWPPREHALGEGFAAITGTKAELRSKLNTPVDAVRMEIDGAPTGTNTLERAADGGSISSRWSLDNPGQHTARLILKHRLGREFDAARFTIETKPDAPPEVKWLGAIQKELRLRPDDRLEMGYEITDDVGLGAVRLEVQPEGSQPAALPMDMPPRIGRGEPPAWRGRVRQAMGALISRWPQSRVFQLRMRAEDSRPAEFGGPGVGTSEWIVVRIDEGAQSLARQEVFAAHSDARETVEQARQLVQQAKEKIDRHRQDLTQEKVPDDARKELGQAREQLADAHEKLEKLAERLEDSVHATKVPEVKQAAETVEQSREKLENAPLQDTPQQRDKTAAAAKQDAEKAERQLEKLRDEIQRAEPQLQDYAHLKDLEQQQRELVRQAEQNTAQKTPPQQWQQQQQQVAEALRQDTQQQPQAQAASLEQQAKEARQLAAEAREQATGQDTLKQLTQNPTKHDAAEKKALHEQLAHEQEAISQEAKHQLAEARDRQDNATANALPEAVESTEKTSQELAKQNDRAAAQEANQAASQLDQAAKSAASTPSNPSAPSASDAAADLSHLADRQKKVAEAISALDQGKPEQATAKLSELGAEKAADLAGDIHKSPQVNGQSGPMQQAAQSSQQAANQAKQAAEDGSQGKASEASGNHGQSSQQLQQAASQLDQAAAEFSQQAATAAGQKAGNQLAPVPAQPLANAFLEAAQAANANSQPAAASHANAAASALAQAADGTLRAMQGQGPPHQGPPGQSKSPDAKPGSDLTDVLRTAQGSPGVPPELAKLGVSAADWEKIKAALKSESGASSSIALPEEYRDLVRRYFEEISKGTQQ